MKRLLVGVAVASLSASLTAQTSSQPRQGWAHQDKVIDLQPNRRGEANEVIDRLMIGEVFSRWGIGFDEGRADVIASLFTDDGVLESMEGSGRPTLTVRGAKEIGASMVRFQQRQADQRRHSMTNVVIESLTKDRALALAYGIVTMAKKGELALASSVVYRAELKKGSDGIWRFSRFAIGMDIYVRDKPQT
jgi:hypothetical protein